MPTPTHPKPAGDCQGQDLGDEYLFYDRSGDQFHVLNGTAREIFLLCDGTRTEDEIAAAFAERYDVEHERAQSDLAAFAGQLIAGSSVSFTVTVKLHAAVLPTASVTVKVSVVVPTGKVAPLPRPAVWIVDAPLQLSVPTGSV